MATSRPFLYSAVAGVAIGALCCDFVTRQNELYAAAADDKRRAYELFSEEQQFGTEGRGPGSVEHALCQHRYRQALNCYVDAERNAYTRMHLWKHTN